MKRLPGESFENYRARRAETNAVTRAHLDGRLSNGRYVDPALHSLMSRDGSWSRAKKQGIAVMMCVLAGGIGWLIGIFLYWLI